MSELKKILRGKGYKATRARLFILDVFSKNKTPLDAEAVYKKLKNSRKTKNINKATVYRTLSSLKDAEVLKKVDLQKDSMHFELNHSHHHHIVCTNCNTIEDFEDLIIEKALERVSTKYFKKISKHSLEFFGICTKCTA